MNSEEYVRQEQADLWAQLHEEERVYLQLKRGAHSEKEDFYS